MPCGIFLSDRSCQYCSKRFRKALKCQNIIESMSRKGNCWAIAIEKAWVNGTEIEIQEWVLTIKAGT
jgi:transposase InsO family protein